MGLYTDIVSLIGSGYATTHILDDGAEVPVNLASASVAALDDVRDLLTMTLDHNEPDIELINNGGFVSLYGVEAELTWVQLLDTGGSYWVHAFEYSNITDYNTGSTLQTPAAEARV